MAIESDGVGSVVDALEESTEDDITVVALLLLLWDLRVTHSDCRCGLLLCLLCDFVSESTAYPVLLLL
jgi:hypothetical protein